MSLVDDVWILCQETRSPNGSGAVLVERLGRTKERERQVRSRARCCAGMSCLRLREDEHLGEWYLDGIAEKRRSISISFASPEGRERKTSELTKSSVLNDLRGQERKESVSRTF